MKTINMIRALFMAGVLMTLLLTQAAASDGKKSAGESYEDEIRQYVEGTDFPQDFKGGVVMVRFTMDERHHIQNVRVYTENEALKVAIARSLAGKPIKHFLPVSYQQKSQDYYMLRLHIAIG